MKWMKTIMDNTNYLSLEIQEIIQNFMFLNEFNFFFLHFLDIHWSFTKLLSKDKYI